MELQAKEILSPKEYDVWCSALKGLGNSGIAAEIGSNARTVKVLKNRIKKKIGDKHFVNFFSGKRPGAEPVLFEPDLTRDSVSNILTDTEYRVLTELEKIYPELNLKSKEKNYRIAKIAGMAGLTKDTVKTSIKSIQNKLGPHLDEYLAKQNNDMKIKIMQSASDGTEDKAEESCENCLRLVDKIHNNGSKTLRCHIQGRFTLSSSKIHRCEDYKSYPPKKLHEKDYLEERLKDKGFLSMAYSRYALGIEPESLQEKLQYGINSLGNKNTLLTQRARHFSSIAQSARYPLVLLTEADLAKGAYTTYENDAKTGKKKQKVRHPIKEFLGSHRIKPVKTEYEVDSEGQERSIGYYVIKNPAHLKTLYYYLIGNVEFHIPEMNSLLVCFDTKILLRGIYCKAEGENPKRELILDSPNATQETHSAEFISETGRYEVTIAIGDGQWGSNFSFLLEVVLDDESQPYIAKQQVIFPN